MFKRAVWLYVFSVFAATLWAEGLPRAVTAYYEDWNYVARNSTWHQREALWSAYWRGKTAVLSGVEQEILIRMRSIVDATGSREFSMPMLLKGTEPPVTPEILAPSKSVAVGAGEILVQVKVMQLPIQKAELGPRSGPRGNFQHESSPLSMCQYTDRWVQRDGLWQVIRSPAVWVLAK